MNFSYLLFFQVALFPVETVCTERLPKKVHPWETSTKALINYSFINEKWIRAISVWRKANPEPKTLKIIFHPLSKYPTQTLYPLQNYFQKRLEHNGEIFVLELLLHVLPLCSNCWRFAIFSWQKNRDKSADVWKRILYTVIAASCFFPIGSMDSIFTYIWLIFMVNVSKYTIHGSYGFGKPRNISSCVFNKRAKSARSWWFVFHVKASRNGRNFHV